MGFMCAAKASIMNVMASGVDITPHFMIGFKRHVTLAINPIGIEYELFFNILEQTDEYGNTTMNAATTDYDVNRTANRKLDAASTTR